MIGARPEIIAVATTSAMWNGAVDWKVSGMTTTSIRSCEVLHFHSFFKVRIIPIHKRSKRITTIVTAFDSTLQFQLALSFHQYMRSFVFEYQYYYRYLAKTDVRGELGSFGCAYIITSVVGVSGGLGINRIMKMETMCLIF